MHIYKLGKTDAGYILSMLSIGLIAGSIILSIISNRLLKSRKKVLIISSAITSLITALLAFNTNGFSELSLYILCFFLGMSSGSISVISFTYVKELFPIEIAGTSTGLVNLFPFAGGAILQQVIGSILEYYGKTGNVFNLKGYEQGFLALFICALISLIFSILIKDTFKNHIVHED
jgi:MFS family permease